MKRQVNSRYVTHLRTPGGARYSLRRTPLKTPEAMCRVGMYFEHGIGTYKDTESALHWYNEAAQQGNKLAQRNLKKLQSLISS